MDMDVRSQRDGSLMERQRSWPRRQRSKRGGYLQRQKRECVRSIIEPHDHVYSNQGGYIERQERECVRNTIVPFDNEYNSFGSRFLQQEDNCEYPATFRTNHSISWVRSKNARPVENSREVYMEEDVHVDRSLWQLNAPQRTRFSEEDVVPDQPFSRSSHSRSRRSPDTLSYTSFRRDSTKKKSYHNDARHPRNFERNHQYRAKRWEDDQSTRELSQDYNNDRYERSPATKRRFASPRGFTKPISNRSRFGGKPKKQIRQSTSEISEEPTYTPKVHVPDSKIVKTANVEKKCSKDKEVDSGVKDIAKVVLKKESTDQMKSAKRDHKEVAEGEKQDDDAGAKPSGSTSNPKGELSFPLFFLHVYTQLIYTCSANFFSCMLIY